MSEEKKYVGDLFKTKREEMNLSLKEVENATSIRILYLQAIEDGNVEKYLSPVYALGFIRQYASFLGLDSEKIIKENEAAFIMPASKQEFDYGIGTLEVRNPPSSGVKWLPNLIWIGSSTLVIFLIWLLAKFFRLF
ncbi:MAG: helix-turn-helix domain-containing protein [Chlamydiae bacterium]|nr:helix-turn-helix domain-containing protein [Chlamydiota bacterium]